ncbi:DEAD/DEAH box helicase [Corynebacterium sanguinis]|uniref:DEAD/DEAH box helicase n=1 Tax=Corynebacterium sanguinis TaxID=2594913 RepID=A0A6C1TZ81_9CORY|nr:DEAD/DEAH box helicase [Corynebacterium sanguinis]TVS29812.1 DEAD/DEAH box helicase [Corynebacterium sanguinis]
MKFVPHDYQSTAINFIETHPETALLLQMGLGKTVITLTAIDRLMHDHFDVNRALVIAPIRVARDTWPQETTKWDHLTHLRMAVMVGTATERRHALNQDADIWTINRENIPWLIKELKGQWPFDMVIIDELSSFKSNQSKRWKALRKVRPQIRRIVGLTGTPAPNSLMDLWAQFALIDQGERLEKTITAYRDRYFRPGRRKGHIVYEWLPHPDSEEKIHNAIRDITLSMKTTDHLDLPAATHTTIDVHMTPQQRRTYDNLKRDMVAELPDGTTVDAANAAALSGQLLQLASGAIYNDAGGFTEIHTAKIDALVDLVEQAEGETILVAYWFKHERARILDAIPGAVALDTTADFQAWNRGDIPVALIHPASAGHGLNLQTGGHILVWTTTPWSLELYEQTNARLNRQGQTHPVSIIHLVTAGTIDVDVHTALARKDVTQSALIDAVAATIHAHERTAA